MVQERDGRPIVGVGGAHGQVPRPKQRVVCLGVDDAGAAGRRRESRAHALCDGDGYLTLKRESLVGRGGGQRLAVGLSRVNVGHESVAKPWHRDDEPMVVGRFAERLSKERDIPRQPAFLHDGVAPDVLQQLVLAEDAVPILDERHEQVQHLRGQRLRCVVAQQEPPTAVEKERVELVDL